MTEIFSLELDHGLVQFSKIEHESTWFPGGEPHARITHPESIVGQDVVISVRAGSPADWMEFMALSYALMEERLKSIMAFIPYFPGARQDRVAIRGEALTVKMYADMLPEFEEIVIMDPHSDVTLPLIENGTQIPQEFVLRVCDDQSLFMKGKGLIVPDTGATKKAEKVAREFGIEEILTFTKVRDVRTGKLSGFKPIDKINDSIDYVIVDDICDGGGTFIGIANELKKHTDRKPTLFTTHGLYSKGLRGLGAAFKQIISTDSFPANEGRLYSSSIDCHRVDSIMILEAFISQGRSMYSS